MRSCRYRSPIKNEVHERTRTVSVAQVDLIKPDRQTAKAVKAPALFSKGVSKFLTS